MLTVRTLKHITAFSSNQAAREAALVNSSAPNPKKISSKALSELPDFLSNKASLNVPVYTVYGATEDITVVEKFRNGTYSVKNLFVIDETTTYAIETPNGPKLRLAGIGGALVLNRFFDNGDGLSRIAGTHGFMWTTALQIGQLIQTVKAAFDPSETNILITHPSPMREPLMLLLALTLRADFTLSSCLHLLYSTSSSEFAATPSIEQFHSKLLYARKQFREVYDSVDTQMNYLLEDNALLRSQLDEVLSMFSKLDDLSEQHFRGSREDGSFKEYVNSAYRTMWHFNLCDVEYGSIVLAANKGRIGAEIKSKGFDFSYRTKPKREKFQRDKFKSDETKPQRIANESSQTLPDEVNSEGSNGKETENGSTTVDQSKGNSRDAPRYGVWIPSCNDDEEEVRAIFAEQDRQLITKIVIKWISKGEPRNKNSNAKQDDHETNAEKEETAAVTEEKAEKEEETTKAGEEDENESVSSETAPVKRRFARVYFSSNEEAQGALDRLDQEKAGGHASLLGYGHRAARGGLRGRGRGRGRPYRFSR